jgi:hypothetical protein
LPLTSAARFSPCGPLGIALLFGCQAFHNETDIGEVPLQPDLLRTIIASGAGQF